MCGTAIEELCIHSKLNNIMTSPMCICRPLPATCMRAVLTSPTPSGCTCTMHFDVLRFVQYSIMGRNFTHGVLQDMNLAHQNPMFIIVPRPTLPGESQREFNRQVEYFDALTRYGAKKLPTISGKLGQASWLVSNSRLCCLNSGRRPLMGDIVKYGMR